MQFFKNLRLQQLALIATVIILNINTLHNQYALDDAIVITQNQFVKKGFGGIGNILTTDSFQGFFGQQKDLVAGGRYRPLSLITFAIEYQLFGLNPMVGHFINVMLYSLVVIILFSTLCKLLKDSAREWFSVAWLAAFIYAVHPIHTEVVANIKGRDEILALLFALIAWRLLLDCEVKPRVAYLLAASVSIFAGCMSKEHAVAFVLLIPLSMRLFYGTSYRKLLLTTTPLLLGSVLFLIIRNNVLGSFSFDPGNELMNNPFVDANGLQRIATILFTTVWYIKLLFFPHPLTFDYYPYHVPLIDPTSAAAILSLLFIVILLLLAFYGLIKYKQLSFWIIFFFASFAPMSNMFFTVGTFMNERFMFIPSISFAVAVAWFSKWLFKRHKLSAQIFLTTITLLSAIKVYSRNGDWYDDFTLFSSDVRVSANSAKSNVSLGGKLFEKAQHEQDTLKQLHLLSESDKYLSKALTIHPTYNDARLLKGNVIFKLHSPDSAMYWYLKILEQAPKHSNAWRNSLIVAENITDIDKRLAIYAKLYLIDSTRHQVAHNIGLIYSKNKNDYAKGLLFLEKAYQMNPSNKDIIRDLGITYGLLGDFSKSEKLFTTAIAQYPNDGQLHYNLGITLYNQRKYNEAQTAFDKASELDKNIKPVKINKP